MAKRTVDIGLDIGIASVGWAIATADDKHEIIKHGVRLFDTVDDKKDSSLKNEQRRLKRHLRRQYARTKTRKREMVKLMVESGLVSMPNANFRNRDAFLEEFRQTYVQNKDLIARLFKKYGPMYVYEIRAKGTKEKLSKEELVVALYWYASHRGFSYTSVDDKDDASKKQDAADYASLYATKYHGKGPAEAQLDFFKHHFAISKDDPSLPPFLKGSFNRGIKRSDYAEELKKILKTNASLLPKGEFAQKFLELFEKQRDFSEGPGDENSPTPYGRFFKKDGKGNIVRRSAPLANLWDEKIGNCALYPDQPRAPKASVAAQLFNLLNAVNNTRVENGTKTPFDEEMRIEIVKAALTKKDATNTIVKAMAKMLDLPEGAEQLLLPTRASKTKKGDAKDPKLPSLESFHEICKHLPVLKHEAYQRLFDAKGYVADNVFDVITTVLYKNRTEESRAAELALVLKKHDIKCSDEELLALAKMKMGAQTHGFSFKALGQFIGEMLKTGANGEQIKLRVREEQGSLNREESVALYGDMYLKSDWVHDAIGVPTVRRSVVQSIVVLNAIFTYCQQNDLQIDDIVIEMAREKNNKEEREKYEAINANREETRKAISTRLEGIQNPTGTLVYKAWLLEQQKCHDAYTGELIQGASGASGVELERVLRGFEIDHIIPRTQSFDNSRSNAVLTSKDNNAKKGNRTPYQFMGAQKHAEVAKQWAVWYRDSQFPFKDKRKLERLMSQVDYSDVNNQEGFINRNLVDTQYATKEVLFALRSFLANRGSSTKVKTINGRMTSYFRGRLHRRWIDKETGELKFNPEKQLKRPSDVPESMDIKKDRTWHGHHAEDAYIVLLLNSQYVKGKQIEKYFLPSVNRVATKTNFDKFTMAKNIDELDVLSDIGRSQLNLRMDQMCFSRMIMHPQNVQLFDETLYRGIVVDDDHVRTVTKVDLLSFGNDLKKVKEYFNAAARPEDLANELVIYKKNRPLYDELKRIFDRYPAKPNENPFAMYVADPNEAMFKNKYPYVVVSYIDNGKRVTKTVKNLTVMGAVKKRSSVVKAPNNGHSFYTGANWLELHVYKKSDGNLITVPVSAVYYSFVKDSLNSDKISSVPKESLFTLLDEYGVPKGSSPIRRLRRGSVLELLDNMETYDLKKGQLVYLCGFESTKAKLEIKPLHRLNIHSSQIRREPAFFVPVSLDVLGSRIMRKPWSEA